MTPESLGQMLEEFLGGSRHAVVLEDGAVVFDLLESKYSISGDWNKCVLHLWSAERNVVRRVVDAEVRNSKLRLMVQKLGQARPSKIGVLPRTRSAYADRAQDGTRRLPGAPAQGARAAVSGFPDYEVE
jgi:hypothetical protein